MFRRCVLTWVRKVQYRKFQEVAAERKNLYIQQQQSTDERKKQQTIRCSKSNKYKQNSLNQREENFVHLSIYFLSYNHQFNQHIDKTADTTIKTSTIISTHSELLNQYHRNNLSVYMWKEVASRRKRNESNKKTFNSSTEPHRYTTTLSLKHAFAALQQTTEQRKTTKHST